MKKFFTGILLTALCLISSESFASVISAAESNSMPKIDLKKSRQDLERVYKKLPDINDKEAMGAYIKERLKVVQHADMTEEEASRPGSVSLVDTNKLKQNQQQTLSAYEKIYNESMKKASETGTLNENTELTGTFFRPITQPENPEQFVPDFPYINIKLSDNREIMAPAEEHIAYLLSTIKIEASGLLKVTEEFVFVSNNSIFPQGFFRILPKYTYSRNNHKRRIDLTLNSVTVNNEEVPYKVTEIGDYLYIEPQKPLELPTGVYTYRFNYYIDRAIWFYDNFAELYWGLTARTLPDVVGSANAVVILPTNNEFLAQNAIVSTRDGIFPERVTIANIEKNVLAFADTEALGTGDEIHLFLTLNKNTLIAPDLLTRYLWFVQDHGMVLFALLALLAIFLSYRISLKQIRQNQDKTNAVIKKTPAVFRLINTGIYDKRSLLAEILNLTNKNIISLATVNGEPTLIKKTDNLSKLSKTEQKLIKKLFPTTETILSASAASSLKLQRAYKFLARKIYQDYTLYLLKLNRYYLTFGFAMLICGIFAASAIAVNPTHTFWVIFVCTALMLPYCYLLEHTFKHKTVNIVLKIFSGLAVLGIAAWMSIYTSYTYAAIILISLGIIFYYHRLFCRRNGLLRNKVKETEEYKSYLQKNTELTVAARDFNSKIPYIYAFGLENKFKDVAIFSQIEEFAPFITATKEKE